MKLVYPMLNLNIEFEENVVNSLILENQNLFYETINEIHNQIEGLGGNFVLSENYEPVEMRKTAELVTQFVPFTLNKKDILTKLYIDIQKQSQSPEMLERTNTLLSELERYVCDISDVFANDLECTPTVDIVPLLKMFDLRFSEDERGLCEKILDYFAASERYKGKRLFITVNLRSYIDDEKAKLFFHNIVMRKTKLLCIENHAYTKFNCEKRIIIDNDLCVI